MPMRLEVVSRLVIICLVSAIPIAASDQLPDLATPTAALAVSDHEALGISISADIAGFETTTYVVRNAVYDRFEVGEEGVTTWEGWPELPIVARTALVPPTAPVGLRVNSIESEIVEGISPFIAPQLFGPENADLPGEPAQEYLTFDGFWPPEAITLGQPAILRGYRLVTVLMYPYQYNPGTGEMRVNHYFDYELTFDSGEVVNPVLNPERSRRSMYVDMMLQDLVVNPPAEPQRDELRCGSYLYIVPQVNGLDAIIAPLIEWRTRQGHRVVVEHLANNAAAAQIGQVIRQAYESDDPVEFVTLVGDANQSAYNLSVDASNIGDYTYTCLDGNDPLPDIALGRLSASNETEMRRIVNKVVTYETNPYMQNTDWFKQGGVVAGHVGNGLGTVLVAKYNRKLLLEHGWREVRGWYHNVNGEITSNQPFITETLNWGVSAFSYRAYQYMNGLSQQVLWDLPNTNGRWPMVSAISCNTGDINNTTGYSEVWLRSAGGAIASIGTATSGTAPQYNNMVSAGLWKGLYRLRMHNPGWALVYAKYELWRTYDGFDGRYAGFMEWNNLMGDAGLQLWTDIPQIIDVEYDANIALGQSVFIAWVYDHASGDPVADAQVCLYKAGDVQIIGYTDQEGIARLSVPCDELTAGRAMVTVTKHDVKPFLGTVDVVSADYYFGAEQFTLDDVNGGDGDHSANPGESMIIDVNVMNFGSEQPEGGLVVNGESRSNWAQVVGGPFNMNQAPQPGQGAIASLVVQVSPDAPDGSEIPIDLRIINGDRSWNSALSFVVAAPKLTITDWTFEGGAIDRGQIKYLNIEVTNVGHKAIAPFQATLSSSSDVIMVRVPRANYDQLAPNRSETINGDQFRVQAHVFSIPGMTVTLQLTAESQAGFHDTTSFSFRLTGPATTDPFGPDKYGYVCFDNGDEGWEMAPRYNWIEIDPNQRDRRFNGVNTQIRDTGDNQDQNTVVALPFPFQYYGQVFDSLTICSNGWVAFGNQRDFLDFRNRHIAAAEGPDAHVCVFWDNLVVNQGGIYTYFDADSGRYIVEWSRLNRLGGGEAETFELILHDIIQHPTYTGDGIILFQYLDVVNGATASRNDSPYCTIGIGNLDDSDGLEYTYWNIFNPGARRPLADGLAIKFTTAVEFITGVLAGAVTDTADGQPIRSAQLTTSRGFWGESDSTGSFYIDDILIGDHYTVAVTAQGYNPAEDDNNGEGFSIAEDETTWVNFSLLHPEFNIDVDHFHFQLNAEDTLGTELVLHNDGNGPLDYASRFTAAEHDSGAAGPEQWDTLMVIPAGIIVDDSRLKAVTFVRDHWIVAGGVSNEDLDNLFYIFDRQGQFLNAVPQPPNPSSYGLRDMTFDGENIFAAFQDSNMVLRLNPETLEETGRWTVPGRLRSPSNITRDRDGYFWLSAITNNMFKCELVGDTTLVEVQNFSMRDPRDNATLRINGIEWFRDDPDGFYLYIVTNNAPLGIDNPDGRLPQVSMYKMNPISGEIRFLSNPPALLRTDGGRGGMCITPKWNNMYWAMAVVLDNSTEGDRIAVLDLAPNSSWVDYTPRLASLEPGEILPIRMLINAADLDTGAYAVEIEFRHNAGRGLTRVPVTLLITTSSAPREQAQPLEYALEQNYPNPFNPATTISYAVKYPGWTRLTVYDLLGREVMTLVEERQSPGRYSVALDGANLAAGMYFYRLQTGEFNSVRKMLLLK